MLARVRTSAICGVEALTVDVEVQVANQGKSSFTIIGLGDNAVRESRDRVLAALQHSGFRVPQQILVSLAPAEIRKEGSAFDLPIALGILCASEQLKSPHVDQIAFHGELSLNGTLKGIRGAVALALKAHEDKRTAIVLPRANQREAALIGGLRVFALENLAQAVSLLRQAHLSEQCGPEQSRTVQRESPACHQQRHLADVCGQALAKRALLLAACGGHNLLMIGPPGCGKSMLAERFTSLLPPLEEQYMLEAVRVHSVAGLPLERLLRGEAPFRNPHHVISEAGLIGGGSVPRAGEVSLAHNGVLFLDEFPEFDRNVLEALRAPLENSRVTIARARGSITLPASFQLVAAMNPCPCGRLGSALQQCLCSRAAVQKYLARLSGPILDRIDLHVELEAVPFADLKQVNNHAESEQNNLREAVSRARALQYTRQGCLNARLGSERLAREIKLQDGCYALLEKAAQRLGLSARGTFKILRVAQTIADLGATEQISRSMLAEAIGFRSLERLTQYCR